MAETDAGFLGALSLLGAVGWTAGLVADTAAQTVTDGGVKNALADLRRTISVQIRGRAVRAGWFGDHPQATPTNHDLLRVLRASWVQVAQQKLGAIREMQEVLRKETNEFRDWPELSVLSHTLADELQRLDVAATIRRKPFVESSPVERALIDVVSAAPEQTQGEVDRNLIDDLTTAFVDGILALPIDWSGPSGGVKQRVSTILRAPISCDPSGRKIEPGEAIMNRFVENLKSGLFPEASRAYEIMVGGLIREDISELAETLGANSSRIETMLSEIKLILENAVNRNKEVFDDLLRAQRDEARRNALRVAAEVRSLSLLFGAQEYEFKGCADNSRLRCGELTKTFFGRDQEIEGLFARFTLSPNSMSIVTAPAGMGKSAFLARAVEVAEGRGFAVASHFATRKRQNTVEPRNVLGHLTQQIRAIHPMAEVYPSLARDIESLRDEIDSHLCRPRHASRPLIIFIDGIDEMSEKLPVFVPAVGLGANIHIVIACRAGGPHDSPSSLVAWGSLEIAKIFGCATRLGLRYDLQPMDRPSMAVWLHAALDRISLFDTLTLIDRLDGTSEGMPIFLQFLIDDISTRLRDGETVRDIEVRLDSLPESFTEYLRIELSEKPGDGLNPYGQAERRFLAFVSAALGPIWDEDLSRLLGQNVDVRNPPQAVSRWLSRVSDQGDSGWIIQHPRLSPALASALGYEASFALDALIEHCLGAMRSRAFRSARYAATWGARHLIEVADFEQAAQFLSSTEFLSWRLEVLPSHEMLQAINDDFSRIERSRPANEAETSDMARIFASIHDSLTNEVGA